MPKNTSNNRSNPTREARSPARQPNPAYNDDWEDLDGSDSLPVISLRHRGEVQVEVTGAMYQAHMPKIARGGNGMCTVVPVVDLANGEVALMLVPAMLAGYLQRQGNYTGLKIHVKDGGVDEEQGWRKIRVRKL